ncbi:pentatricopeptide repeat-containing protein At2g33760-like [Zingiber officinale]|uniref:DYW domain-containing protein n=1 Tax=Zingiber officinale TaxID=94328 RepID=A0A8J5FXR9_ZINOF|nr:pentatricopeptide repeat-containing protein At2g33760-like [Zingiber officinale]KAG6496191.1 hypothetical protein ZIOFF_044039 [Zingiber officinale]
MKLSPSPARGIVVAARPSTHSPTYEALLRAGPRLRPLQQVHARIVVVGLHRTRSLVTKLLTLALSSSSSASVAAYARALFLSVPDPDAFLFSSFIAAAARSGRPADAIAFYRRMSAAGFDPSNYTFTSVVKACADLAASRTGRVVHSRSLVEGFESDGFVQTALVVFYAKSANLHIARKLFDRIPKRTVVAWNAMIAGYEQNGLAEEAVVTFRKMQEAGEEPDSTTLVSLLSACSHIGAFNLGQWVNDYIEHKGLKVNVVLGTSLIHMYARCGHVEKARKVFDEMPERNIVTWTAMMSGYGMHGHGQQAIELFQQMRLSGLLPNDVTFVAILSACAHAGLICEGREAFVSMKLDYGLVPRVEHQACMVDMLGRAGLLDEAMRFIRIDMEGKASAEVWTAMLGACKMHKNLRLATMAAEQLLAIEPENPAHYVLLSNIYASVGRMDQVEKIRDLMIDRQLMKQIGYSSIEIDEVPYVFRMGDASHRQTMEIYRYLDGLMDKIKEAGYLPETGAALHELEEEEREVALRFHSEKLAVAFGLMTTSQSTIIKIFKNLRMCGDCHSAFKFISLVSRRAIVVRDNRRFHHFEQGFCSCQDYW